MESLQRALASSPAHAALVDSANFIDVQRIQTFIVEEVTIV